MEPAMEHEAYLDMAAVEARHWWFRGRRRILEATIRRLKLAPGARILELGSGTGGNLLMLSQFGGVTAVEMNEAAREISRRHGSNADIQAGYLPDDLPLADQKFDLICMFDVLEHVEEDAATLAVVRKHLAPGGAAVITVPAYQALFGPHDVALHHKRRYERAEFAEKLRQAGLRVEKLSFVNTALAPPAFLLRWLDRKLNRTQPSGSKIPPRLLNEAFAFTFGAEAYVLPWINLPFGLSLLAVVRAAR
jgi:SAM-dependent methyltransferase